MKDAINFCKEITKLHEEGYVFDESGTTPRECPVIPMVKNWKFTKKDAAISELSKKVELLAFAEEHGIVIPEDKMTPTASIKKFIKDYLNGETKEE